MRICSRWFRFSSRRDFRERITALRAELTAAMQTEIEAVKKAQHGGGGEGEE